MPRQSSDEAERWYASVYMAVQEIPYGKTTSYGHIALLIGYRPPYAYLISTTPKVGQALKHLPSPDITRSLQNGDTVDEGEAETGPVFHHDNVPWQRVVNSAGVISRRPGAERQAERLRDEGVEVTEVGGESRVDFRACGWFPSILPSEQELEEDAPGE